MFFHVFNICLIYGLQMDLIWGMLGRLEQILGHILGHLGAPKRLIRPHGHKTAPKTSQNGPRGTKTLPRRHQDATKTSGWPSWSDFGPLLGPKMGHTSAIKRQSGLPEASKSICCPCSIQHKIDNQFGYILGPQNNE